MSQRLRNPIYIYIYIHIILEVTVAPKQISQLHPRKNHKNVLKGDPRFYCTLRFKQNECELEYTIDRHCIPS